MSGYGKINPRHLKGMPKSHRSFFRRKGTRRGAKLDWEKAGKIRTALAQGASDESLAAEYKVSVDAIGAIRRGTTWRIPGR